MRHLAVALVWGVVPLVVPRIARAHVSLDVPHSRYYIAVSDEADQTKLKTGPCGVSGDKRTTSPSLVTTFKPGETITVSWRETVQHPGHFRIAFDSDGQDFAVPGTTSPSGVVILADNIADRGGANGIVYTQQVKLPSVECSNCTLQLVQVMTTAAPPYAAGDFYFNCADLVLAAQAGTAGTGGVAIATGGATNGGTSGLLAGGATFSMKGGRSGNGTDGGGTNASKGGDTPAANGGRTNNAASGGNASQGGDMTAANGGRTNSAVSGGGASNGGNTDAVGGGRAGIPAGGAVMTLGGAFTAVSGGQLGNAPVATSAGHVGDAGVGGRLGLVSNAGDAEPAGKESGCSCRIIARQHSSSRSALPVALVLMLVGRRRRQHSRGFHPDA